MLTDMVVHPSETMDGNGGGKSALADDKDDNAGGDTKYVDDIADDDNDNDDVG